MGPLAVTTTSEEATARIGALLGARLAPGDVLALEGELGAGKTALTRGIARGAGAREAVRSPTFTLVTRYEGARLPLVHVDAYRLAGAEDLLALGIEEVLDPRAATVVEWASRVLAALPDERLEIRLTHLGKSRRGLVFRPHGARAEALLGEIRKALKQEAP